MELLLITSIISLTIGLPFSWIRWQLHSKQNTATTLARLTKCKYQQNAKIHKRGQYRPRIVKHHVTYEYTYTVDNKTYRKKGFAFCLPRDLPKMPTVTYLKALPWHGEIQNLTVDISLYVSIFGILYSVVFFIFWLVFYIIF